MERKQQSDTHIRFIAYAIDNTAGLSIWARWPDGHSYLGKVVDDFRQKLVCRVDFMDVCVCVSILDLDDSLCIGVYEVDSVC
jgi:hypothetical protein